MPIPINAKKSPPGYVPSAVLKLPPAAAAGYAMTPRSIPTEVHTMVGQKNQSDATVASFLSLDSLSTVQLEEVVELPLPPTPTEAIDIAPQDEDSGRFSFSDDAAINNAIENGLFEGMIVEPATLAQAETALAEADALMDAEPPASKPPTTETMSQNSVRRPARKKRAEQSAVGLPIAMVAQPSVFDSATALARSIIGDCIPDPATASVVSSVRRSNRKKPNKGSKQN